ncbi:hypothetical protein VTJ83DRAFT_5715 [Remersonia thermophila]|uniref:Uncharacterized protein n=1 Tax=Remersonia thermophila TaxID=72144 RepID=A0ABR4D7M1_9PEZI
MRPTLGYAAFGCALGLANANALPQDTLYSKAALPRYTGNVAIFAKPAAPAVTEPPPVDGVRRRLLNPRQTRDVCGYVNADTDSEIYCPEGYTCYFDAVRRHGLCCSTSDISCPVPTVCMDFTESEAWSSTTGVALWCASTSSPLCVPYVFQDADHLGYTWWGCDSVEATRVVWAAATNPPPPDPSPASDSAPVGAIVGGVVGGVALLAAVALAAWCIMHRKKKKAAAREREEKHRHGELPQQRPRAQDPAFLPDAAASPGAAAAAYNQRPSIAKSPGTPGPSPTFGYVPSSPGGGVEHHEFFAPAGLGVAGGPRSPPPWPPAQASPGYQWPQQPPYPPPPDQQGYGFQQSQSQSQHQPQPQHQPQHQPQPTAELSAEKDGGEARELPA